MNVPGHQRSRASRLFQCVAFACVLLDGLTAVAEGIHSHPGQQKNPVNCSICIAAHHSPGRTSVTFQPSLQQKLVFHVATYGEEPASTLALPFSLSVRPPPSV